MSWTLKFSLIFLHRGQGEGSEGTRGRGDEGESSSVGFSARSPSDQGLQYLLTGFSIKNGINATKYTRRP